jgi:hypothetical protein
MQSQPETVEPYDPEETSSSGLRALVLWLEELGYPVTIGVPRTGLPSGPGLLLIHPTYTGDLDYYSDTEVALLFRWVRRGGTLVLIGATDTFTSLSARFGVEQVESFTGMVSDIRQVQPLLPDIPTGWDDFVALRSLYFYEDFIAEGHAVVPVLAHTNGDPVVALQFIGDGVVWHLTEDFALTNLNLRDERIASLLPAILRTFPAGAPVLFSTHHLARYDPTDGNLGAANTMQDWLYSTPFGQATLLIMVALFLFLLLQGRRLGPALPGPTASRPREAAEYVTALAGLQRRMRQPNVVAAHHRQRLKSAVGRLVQAPADLPDGEWLAQLHRAEALPPAMMDEVTELLAGYAKVDPKGAGTGSKAGNKEESDLIQLVQATDALLASLPRANMQLVR